MRTLHCDTWQRESCRGDQRARRWIEGDGTHISSSQRFSMRTVTMAEAKLERARRANALEAMDEVKERICRAPKRSELD